MFIDVCLHVCLCEGVKALELECWELNPGPLVEQCSQPLSYLSSLCFHLFETGSHCLGPSWPGTCNVDQASLKLKKSACLCPWSAKIKDVCHHSAWPFKKLLIILCVEADVPVALQAWQSFAGTISPTMLILGNEHRLSITVASGSIH